MKKKYLDLAERVFWTFIQTAGAVVIVSGGFNVDVWKAAAAAGGLSVVKCLVAMHVGDRETAAALPGG
jgi:predicted phage tail protein